MVRWRLNKLRKEELYLTGDMDKDWEIAGGLLLSDGVLSIMDGRGCSYRSNHDVFF